MPKKQEKRRERHPEGTPEERGIVVTDPKSGRPVLKDDDGKSYVAPPVNDDGEVGVSIGRAPEKKGTLSRFFK